MPAKRKKATAKRRKTGGVFNFGPRVTKTRARFLSQTPRGGRIFHKYPKVSKTESRRLAQQNKSRKKAWGLLRANKGGVSRHRVGGRRTRRSVFSTPGWRKQLAQTRGVGRRHKLGKPMAHSAASLGRSNKIIRGKIGHKHGQRGGWLPLVGSILLPMLLGGD